MVDFSSYKAEYCVITLIALHSNYLLQMLMFCRQILGAFVKNAIKLFSNIGSILVN